MAKVLYHHKWMDLCATETDDVYIKMDDGVMMIPLTDKNEIIMIEEPSIAYGDTMLAFPMGGIEADETPLKAAERELEEEIGYRAGRLEMIALLHPSLKYGQWRYWVCLARDLTPHTRQGDERTPVISKPMQIEKIDHLIGVGKITDSNVIAAFSLARKHFTTR